MKRSWVRWGACILLAMLTVLGLTVDFSLAHFSVKVQGSMAGSMETLLKGLDRALQTPPVTLGLLLGVLSVLNVHLLFPCRKARAGEYVLACFLAFWLLMSLATLQTDSVSVLWANQTQLAKAACAFFGFVPLWLAIIRAVEWGLNWLANQKAVSMKHPVLVPFCTMLLVWFPQALVRYPGAMVYDTLHQLQEFFGDLPFTAMNPPAHTAFLGTMVSIGDWLGSASFGLFLVVLIQMAALAWILSWFLSLLQRGKAPAPLFWGLFALFVFSPMYSAYATIILKDSACSIAMLLFMVETMVLVMHPDWFWEHKGRNLTLWAVSGVFAILMRKNGIGMVAPTVAAVGIWSLLRTERGGRYLRYLPLICGLAAILVSQSALKLVTSGFAVEGGSIREILSIPFQQTARVLRDQENVPAEEIEIINRVLDAQSIAENYVSFISDNVKNTFREEASAEELIDYAGVWFRQMLRYPGSYADALLGLTHSIFSPAAVPDDFYEVGVTGSINHGKWRVEDWLNTCPLSAFRWAQHRLYLLMLKLPGVGLLLNMGVNGSLVLILGLHTLPRRKALWLLWLPVLLCLVLLVFSPLTCTRYALPVFYGVPLLVSAACAVRREGLPKG